MDRLRDSSNRLIYHFNEIDADDYFYITDSIVKYFELKKDSQLVPGLDEIFQDYKIDEKVVGLEWDNWLGYIVVAQNTESEKFIKEIASFITTIPEKKRMSKTTILIYGTIFSLVLLYWILN